MNWYDQALLDEPVTLTLDAFKAIFPDCNKPSLWLEAIQRGLSRYGIEDPQEIALFLAHIGHESRDMDFLEESLYYSVSRLMVVWPHDFPTRESAFPYAGNETRLGDKVYGDRLGNLAPGDGYKYRGRGLINLTGLGNYTECQEATGLMIVEAPDKLAEEPNAAVEASLWFWAAYVTGSDIKTTTRQVNGGYNGLEDRTRRYRIATSYLSA